MASGVRVEGLNQTVRAMVRAGVEVSDLKETFAEIAAEGARVASQLAPKKSGKLAASVRGNRARNKAVVTAGKARVPYAGAINYGWPRRNIGPSLFMQRADQRLASRIPRMLEDGLAQAIRRAGLDG